jgi:hypothetical protein
VRCAEGLKDDRAAQTECLQFYEVNFDAIFAVFSERFTLVEREDKLKKKDKKCAPSLLRRRRRPSRRFASACVQS